MNLKTVFANRSKIGSLGRRAAALGLVLVFLGGMAVFCDAQVIEHPTYEAAREVAVAAKQDTIVLVHGSDWNPYGEKLRSEAWEAESFREAVGEYAQLTRIDFRENPTEKQKTDYARRIKNFPIKKSNCYPIVHFFDQDGHHYTALFGDSLPGDPVKFTQAVLAKLQARRDRDELWNQANKEREVATKVRLLFEAHQLRAGNLQRFKKAIKKADPKDTQGYLSVLNFDGQALVRQSLKLVKSGEPDKAMALVDSHLRNEHLQPVQRQWALLAKINACRHIPGSKEKMLEVARESEGISTTSIPGRAINVLASKFAKPRKKQ